MILFSLGRDALVHSAAGGVGDMLCQLLKLHGLRVVGVVGSKGKVASCKAPLLSRLYRAFVMLIPFQLGKRSKKLPDGVLLQFVFRLMW